MLPPDVRDRFAEQGYVGPVPTLSVDECQRFLRAIDAPDQPPPLDWAKGHAAVSRSYYELATHPAVIDVVAALLGDDVMLWGASVRTLQPGAAHAWHSDIESAVAPGPTVTVWIGLEHTDQDSALLLLPYTHQAGITVQEARQAAGTRRRDATEDDVVRWARDRDQRSHLVLPDVTDGSAIVIDGRLWHSSRNRGAGRRRAVLLQYATPDTPIRIPDPNDLEWPVRQLPLPLPPCVMIRGTARSDANRFVSGPVADGGEPTLQSTSRIYPMRLPLASDPAKGWKPYHIFRSATADLHSLACRVSVLDRGCRPHTPHDHDAEELLMCLAGEVDLIFPDAAAPGGERRTRLAPGQLVYYPHGFTHTLETVSEEPASYLMFRWHAEPWRGASPLPFGRFDLLDGDPGAERRPGLRQRLIFQGPTGYLRKLHCHVSRIASGAGYDPHVDAYDVAILVLEGEIETLGARATPHGVILYPSGQPHGLRNPGSATATYAVFEFHGSQSASAEPRAARASASARGRPTARPARRAPPPVPLWTKLKDPQRWKRKVARILQRFSP